MGPKTLRMILGQTGTPFGQTRTWFYSALEEILYSGQTARRAGQTATLKRVRLLWFLYSSQTAAWACQTASTQKFPKAVFRWIFSNYNFQLYMKCKFEPFGTTKTLSNHTSTPLNSTALILLIWLIFLL